MGTRVSCKYFYSQLKDGCIRSYLCMRGENQENHRVELSDIDQNVLGKKQIMYDSCSRPGDCTALNNKGQCQYWESNKIISIYRLSIVASLVLAIATAAVWCC